MPLFAETTNTITPYDETYVTNFKDNTHNDSDQSPALKISYYLVPGTRDVAIIENNVGITGVYTSESFDSSGEVETQNTINYVQTEKLVKIVNSRSKPVSNDITTVDPPADVDLNGDTVPNQPIDFNSYSWQNVSEQKVNPIPGSNGGENNSIANWFDYGSGLAQASEGDYKSLVDAIKAKYEGISSAMDGFFAATGENFDQFGYKSSLNNVSLLTLASTLGDPSDSVIDAVTEWRDKMRKDVYSLIEGGMDYDTKKISSAVKSFGNDTAKLFNELDPFGAISHFNVRNH